MIMHTILALRWWSEFGVHIIHVLPTYRSIPSRTDAVCSLCYNVNSHFHCQNSRLKHNNNKKQYTL